MAASRKIDIVGIIPKSVRGVAPVPALQNILGENWPTPPLQIDGVSYVYVLSEDEIGKTLSDAMVQNFARNQCIPMKTDFISILYMRLAP